MTRFAATAICLLLHCPTASFAEDEVDLATMLVGNWQDGDVRLKIEQKKDKTMLLIDHRKGREQDHLWKLVGKVEAGKPIKFSYLPLPSEIPDKTDSGKPLTDQMKKDALATKGEDRFQWLVEFDKVDDWGKCSATVHATFYPGSIDYDTKDDGKTAVDGTFKAKSGGTPGSKMYKRLDPAIKFVEGTGRQKQCTPHFMMTTTRCTGTVYHFIFPGSTYDSAAGRQSATAHIKDSKEFFATYCIDLTDQELAIAAADAKKLKLKERYDAWYTAVLAKEMGGKVEALGKNTINGDHIAEFKGIIADLQKHLQGSVKGNGTTPLIVFMNEYIGGADSRETLVSSTQESAAQVGIDTVDKDSSHMLTHELVHMLGKPSATGTGAMTWQHNSDCDTAVSRVKRTDPRQPENLSDRFLDFEEYKEIVKNGAAGALKCETISY